LTSLPDWNLLAAAVFAIFVLYFLSRMFYRPLQIILKAGCRLLLGGAAILLFNLVGAYWGITVGLNIYSTLIVALMGLPGLGMLIALTFIV
jgi:inhibitor of the pro-sigma K processing machinery